MSDEFARLRTELKRNGVAERDAKESRKAIEDEFLRLWNEEKITERTLDLDEGRITMAVPTKLTFGYAGMTIILKKLDESFPEFIKTTVKVDAKAMKEEKHKKIRHALMKLGIECPEVVKFDTAVDEKSLKEEIGNAAEARSLVKAIVEEDFGGVTIKIMPAADKDQAA